MKRILFVVANLKIGGIRSSLLQILKVMSDHKYEIDVAVVDLDNDISLTIPPGVTLIPLRNTDQNSFIKFVFTLANYLRYGGLLERITVAFGNPERQQLVAFGQKFAISQAKGAKQLTKFYDVAIGFSEQIPNAYVAYKINAYKKIAWIHPDYRNAQFDPRIDYPIYKIFDSVVTVSPQCKESFDICFPEFAAKSIVIENLLPNEEIIKKSIEFVPIEFAEEVDLNLVSVCRLEIFSKGLDRAVEACKHLVDKGVNVRWIVVGEGIDRRKLQQKIDSLHLKNHFVLVGSRANPYPYIRYADAFVLPSRYEGKPIVVSEALLLKCPVIVTKYMSAHEQVLPGINGFIIENNDEVFIQELYKFCKDKNGLSTLRKSMLYTDASYNNLNTVQGLFSLIEQ